MIVDLVSHRPISRGTVLRCFGPAGLYWRETFRSKTAIYINEGDLIFTACHFDEEPHEGDYYSEFDEPTIDELRLLAALILPIGPHDGMLVVYPLQPSLGIGDQIDLSQPSVSEAYSLLVRSKLEFQNQRAWRYGPIPPVFGGEKYDYRDAHAPAEMQGRIYEVIDVSDHLLMRGLNALMKAGMLQAHAVFGEQAHYCLYIALDASHQLILRMLREAGLPNPSSVDAASFMSEAFGERPSGRKYFEDYYQDRIMTFHPESRFGVVPYAPLMNSHFYGLYYDLRDIYRWIVLRKDFDLRSS